MNARDFRIGEPVPLDETPDAPVRLTVHMSPLAAAKMADEIVRQLGGAKAGQWIEINVIGLRLVPQGLENLIVRGSS